MGVFKQQAGVISKSFKSSEQPIVAAGAASIAHNFGVAPSFVNIHLICKVSEGGYIAGDIVPMKVQHDSASGADNFGISCIIDANNIVLRFGSNPAVFIILDATSGNQFPITLSKWRVIIRCLQ